MTITFRSAVLFVQDIETSRRFYESLLGQQVLMDHGPNVGFDGFAIWQADHARQVMGQEVHSDPLPLGTGNLELYFETTAMDTVVSALADFGVRLVHALQEQPWGQRVIRVYDPDGYIVEIGEPMPVVIQRFLDQGLPVDKIAQRTSMPIDIVEQVVNRTQREQQQDQNKGKRPT